MLSNSAPPVVLACIPGLVGLPICSRDWGKVPLNAAGTCVFWGSFGKATERRPGLPETVKTDYHPVDDNEASGQSSTSCVG